MANDTSSNKNVMAFSMLGVVALAVIGFVGYTFTSKDVTTEADIETALVSEPVNAAKDEMAQPEGFPPMPASIEPASGNVEDDAPSETVEPEVADSPLTPPASVIESQEEANANAHDAPLFDLNAVLAERGYGDPNAPIRIDEFASLTCSHCASFHANTFPALKEKYIDTGKVYFVFNDFPLDRAALDATITARCLPQERHESFLKLLFETQRMWATEGYQKALRQNAKLAGLSDEQFDACLESDEIKKGLEKVIMQGREDYNVQSTPSFIINKGEETIRGASSIGTFDQVIGKLLAE